MVETNNIFVESRCDIDAPRFAARAEAVAERVARELAVEPGARPRARVVVEDGASCVVGEEIRLGVGGRRGALTVDDWLELQLAHELAHLLVSHAWAGGRGLSPALLWEGIPVWIGDNHVRTRVLGKSYHAYCRALAHLGRLLPLGELVTPRAYYRRRPDFRVDLQAGSFCGYLLASHGPERLARVVADIRGPTLEDPRIVLGPALRRHLGADLGGLAAGWRQFLERDIELDDAPVDRLRRLDPKERPNGRKHCNFCHAPIGDARPTCSACGAPADLDIAVA